MAGIEVDTVPRRVKRWVVAKDCLFNFREKITTENGRSLMKGFKREEHKCPNNRVQE